MLREDLIRLRHMLDAATAAIGFCAGLDRRDLDRDTRTILAVVKAVEIVGEAASRVSLGCRESHPGIAWADVIAMRNRLVHAYFDIDLDILWKTVVEDLPQLVAQLESSIPTGEA